MKKMNNKGFMMAEVVVVSSIVLVFLAGLYASYNKIYTSYRNLINYYDITTLYKLGYYRDTLINNINDSSKTNINDILSMVNDKAGSNTSTFYVVQDVVSSDANEKVFLIRNGKNNLTNNFADSSHQVCSISSKTSLSCSPKKLSNEHITFKEYLNFLSTSVDLSETNYVMVMEKCADSDANNCKYAYLEVKDGKE